MDYLPAEPRQEAETAIITTTTSTIRPVINRGSVCVCIMCLQCVCVQWKWLKVVQRGGNTREREGGIIGGEERRSFYCPLSILNLKVNHLVPGLSLNPETLLEHLFLQLSHHFKQNNVIYRPARGQAH